MYNTRLDFKCIACSHERSWCSDTTICVSAVSKEKKSQGMTPLPPFPRSMLLIKVLRDWAASLLWPVEFLMRRHRLRSGGGGDGGSLGSEAEPGVNAALVGVLEHSESEPEAVAGGAPEGGLLDNDRACVVGGDSAAASCPCSCSISELKLEAAKALPPVCSFGTSPCSSRSSMPLRPS
jgi:hypothetical protein